MSPSPKILSTKPLASEDAKWTRLILTTYTDPLSRARTWEHAERPTRPKTSDIDGVGIVAILDYGKEGGKGGEGPEIVLQKQWRAPLNKVVIEVPAGLVDEGESAEECALRELREETGYVGEVIEGGTGVLWNDPGFCTTNLKMIHVKVDMSLPENKNPKPQLEEGEFIEVFTLPMGRLWEECRRLEKEGFAIDARVGTLAEGIEMARMFKL